MHFSVHGSIGLTVKQVSLLPRWPGFESHIGEWVFCFAIMTESFFSNLFFANKVLKTIIISLIKQCNAGVMFFKNQN